MGESTDADLLQRWQAGEQRAGAELARRYFSALRAYFLSKVPAEFEDLVANTMLRLVDKRDGFRGQSSFRVYLFGIAKMILLEHFRARKRDERFDPMESSVVDLEEGRLSSILGERDRHRVLFDALRHLELREQELLELYYWQQLSAREIADLQSSIEATVRSRIRAALKRLAKLYAQLDAQPHEHEFDPDEIEGWLQDMRAQLDEAKVVVAA